MEPRLPSEADLSLARRLEGGLAERGSADAVDPLEDALRAYHEDYAGAEANPDSDRIWSGIAAGMHPAPVRRLRPSRPAIVHRMRTYWMPVALAASLALLIGLPFLLTSTPDERLLAAANGSVETWRGADGTEVTLRPGARLFGSSDRTQRLEGEAFFDVAHDPEAPFTVSTAFGTVAVLGTRFNLRAGGDETTVYLESGRVAYRTGESAVELAPGEGLRAAASGINTDGAETEAEALDWLRGELVFAGRTASSVTRELAGHFGLDLSVPEGMRQETLSGRILLEDADRALGDLGMVLGGTFVRVDENRYRLQEN